MTILTTYKTAIFVSSSAGKASLDFPRNIKMDQGMVQSCAVVALIRQLVELLRECYLNMLIPTWPLEAHTRVRGASILVLCGSPLVSVSGPQSPPGRRNFPAGHINGRLGDSARRERREGTGRSFRKELSARMSKVTSDQIY